MSSRPQSGASNPKSLPDAQAAAIGAFGGRYVPETLVPALDRLQAGVDRYLHAEDFQAEFHHELATWVGRPTALSFAPTLSKRWGAKVWLKREDLAHTGAHKINNAIGQTLLAKRLGARRLIAETGAGQHGVAIAAAAARLGMPCVVYMGAVDVERQAPNVGRMKLLGATVVPVVSGDRTLRAAIDEALRDWVSDPDGTYYALGSAVGPHPYPYLVRELQSVIGKEARAQMLMQAGALPDVAVACVGGGSNAIGLFHPFVGDASVKLLGVEAGGRGSGLGDNAASLTFGTPGVLQGATRSSCRMTSGRSARPTRCRPVSTIRASGPSTPICRTAAGSSTSRPPTRRPWMRSPNARAAKASSRRSSPPTRFSEHAATPVRTPVRASSSAARDGATKT